MTKDNPVTDTDQVIRPMTGFMATLSSEQKMAALSFCGDDTPVVAETVPIADMFWNADDSEQQYHSFEDLLEDHIDWVGLGPSLVEVWTAHRMPTVWAVVLMVDGEPSHIVHTTKAEAEAAYAALKDAQ